MTSISKLKHPIVQAPMAGGVNTPEMVSEVINAGAVGSYGFAYSRPEQIQGDLQAARDKIRIPQEGALNCNFFVFPEAVQFNEIEAVLQTLAALPICRDMNIKRPTPPFFPRLDEQLEVIWENPPDLLTFHFGIPPLSIIRKAHSLDVAVGITATSLAEARQIEEAGADLIVAQGIEAGGHRGIFDPESKDNELSTMDLVRQLSSETNLPLVAAGGIMNGRHLRIAVDCGAIAVQMGTAFLTCLESGASAAHQRILLEQKERPTQLTRAFSGRPARAVVNEFIRGMAGKPVLPFPVQNDVTAPIRKTARQNNDAEYQSLWAGVNYSECRRETVGELIARVSGKK